MLADAIAFTKQIHPRLETMLELSTLTGAAVVALGTNTAALFSNQSNLAASIENTGKAVGERFWRLPITTDMLEMMSMWSPENSNVSSLGVADLNNVSPSKYGGSIEGAAFLANFFNWKSPHTKHLEQQQQSSIQREFEELELSQPGKPGNTGTRVTNKQFGWAHLDIAGPALLESTVSPNEKELDFWAGRLESSKWNKLLLNGGVGEFSLMKEGATGFGVSTLVRYCQKLAAS